VPPPIVDPFETQANAEQPTPIDHKDVLPIQIPTTKLGSLRSAHIFDARIYGLRLNKEHAKAILALQMMQCDPTYKRTKLKIFDMVTKLLDKSHEFLSVSEEDLNYMEEIWGGDPNVSSRRLPSRGHFSCCQLSTYFVLMEFATYMERTDWTIAREITYLAISKRALSILTDDLGYLHLDTVLAKARPCDPKVWRDSIECLRLGSPLQHFRAAISCVLVSFRGRMITSSTCQRRL
jgi:hypothetical protein